MRIIGCDLHARQQTLAMLDATTGDVVNRTLLREAMRCGNFIHSFPARCSWAWKRSDRCSGF